MFTPTQQSRFDSLLPAEIENGEEAVLFLRISATNTAVVPRYAFLRTIWPSKGSGEGNALPYRFEGDTGLGVYESGRIFAISKLDGAPLQQEEAVILLQPGESTVMDVFLPHRPISRERAQQLSHATFEQQKQECKAFWQSKLKDTSRIELPEKRITEMIQAGFCILISSRMGASLMARWLQPSVTILPSVLRAPPSFNLWIRWDGTIRPDARSTIFWKSSMMMGSCRTLITSCWRPEQFCGA